MTVIAGFIRLGADLSPASACATMLEALAPYGGDGSEFRQIGDAAFGRDLRKLLPEDDFDAQPLTLEGGRLLMAADVRIDNPSEIVRALGMGGPDAATVSDAALLGASWERWGADAFDHLLGDFAMAVWDSERRSLTLARSAMSKKPLFYATAPGFLAFASMPAGLHALSSVPKEINFPHAAAVVAQYTYPGSATIFRNVRSVQHGTAVELKGGDEKIHRFWAPQRDIVRYKRPAEYAERLRAEMDRAVAAQLRRHHGKVAAQLSAGRDSSAVASTAARILAANGEDMLALTAAPRVGFAGPSLAGKLVDESPLAAATAAMHANVRHVICRTGQSPVFDLMTAMHRLHFGPLLNPSNLNWWSAMDAEAKRYGAAILLNGSTGNFGLSAGGVDQLRDMLVDDGPLAWLATAVRIGRISPIRWRNIANVSFGPTLSPGAYRWLLGATGRPTGATVDFPILRPPHRVAARQVIEEAFSDPRPPRSFSAYRLEVLLKRDIAEKITLARCGIETRDPTADRRLIEFCFSLPNEQLVSARTARPAFDDAFGDRIPRAVLRNPLRGYQTADWFEHFDRDGVRQAFSRYRDNPVVRELLDLAYLDRLIDRWPSSGWGDRSVIYTYRNMVIGTLALANFIDLHFPN